MPTIKKTETENPGTFEFLIQCNDPECPNEPFTFVGQAPKKYCRQCASRRDLESRRKTSKLLIASSRSATSKFKSVAGDLAVMTFKEVASLLSGEAVDFGRTLTFSVTQEDIDQGERTIPGRCAVSRGISRAIGGEAFVGLEDFCAPSVFGSRCFLLPWEVVSYTKLIDAEFTMPPRTFSFPLKTVWSGRAVGMARPISWQAIQNAELRAISKLSISASHLARELVGKTA